RLRPVYPKALQPGITSGQPPQRPPVLPDYPCLIEWGRAVLELERADQRLGRERLGRAGGSSLAVPCAYRVLDFGFKGVPGRGLPLPRRPFRCAATPLPTAADNPIVNFNLNGQNQIQQTVPNYTVRLDHVFNDKNRAYFRFTEIDQQQQA